MFDRRLMQEMKKEYNFFIASVLMAFIATGFLILEYWWVAKAIHEVFFLDLPWREALPFLVWALIALILRLIFSNLETRFSQRIAVRVQASIRRRLVQKMSAVGPVALAGTKSGEFLSLYFEGVESLEAYFRDYLPQLIKALLIPLLFLAAVLPFDRLSTLTFLLTIPLIPFFMLLIGSWTKAASRRQWKLINQLSGYLQDVIRGLESLIVLGRSKKQGEKIAEISDRYRKAVLRVQKWAFTSSLALELVATISIALVAVGLGLRLVEGDMIYQVALFILFLAPDYYQPMRNLGAYFHTGLDAQEAADDIYAFLGQEETFDPNLEGEPFEFERLVFDKVSYRYPDSETWALKDVSFELRKGQSFALAGLSGSGKSTAMLLALGFVRPQEGQVRINGQVLEGAHLAAWQRMVSYIPQRPHIFQASPLDHLTMGKEEEGLEACARHALEASGFMDSLSSDYLDARSLIGSGGVDLSGGQEELLFLTRALVEERPLLFLDEITDNMDLATEASSMVLIHELLQERSSLIIAHRLATLRQADQVLLFDEGRLVAQDSYDDLSRENPLFQSLKEGGGSLA